MNLSRRQFLRKMGCTVSGAAMFSAIENLTLTNAMAQTPTGYRVLVCVFLAGGNDSNNMVVPLGDGTSPTGGYPAYSTERAASGLGIAQASLLPISPASFGAASFGLHPSLADFTLGTPVVNMPGLATLFNQGRASVVCNVGPLIQPFFNPAQPAQTPRQQYTGGTIPRPQQLFSHSDQINQWQTSISNTNSGTGWGGRAADRTILLNATPGDPAAARFPMITSVSGSPIYTVGMTAQPLTIAPAPTALNQVLVLNGYGTSASEIARRNAFDYLRGIDQGNTLVKSAQKLTDQALAVSAALSVNPTITTPFPNTTLGNQFLQVARVIKANLTQPALGLNRQIFFCQLGGFDTHQNQVGTQSGLLTQLNQAMAAFYYWIKSNNDTAVGDISSQVTVFTLSDFARTFNPSGTGAGIVGTDHAWGSHQFVLGGEVKGGDFQGVPLSSSRGGNDTVFPILVRGNAYDTDTRGRWIPTVGVDQYGATLASWYGVAAADLPTVFPNIGNFAPTTLGFL